MQLEIFKKEVTYLSVYVVFSQMDPKRTTEFPYCRISERIIDLRAGRGFGCWCELLYFQQVSMPSSCFINKATAVLRLVISTLTPLGVPASMCYTELHLTRRRCDHHAASMKQERGKKKKRNAQPMQRLAAKSDKWHTVGLCILPVEARWRRLAEWSTQLRDWLCGL